MSFKMPVKKAKLDALKANAYVQMLALLFKKKFKDGMTVPFMILFNHKYANMDEKKSAKLPLFLIGDRDTSWKDYHKTKLASGELQKKYMVCGTCTRKGSQLVLDIEASKGLNKVPKKILQLIGALIKQRVDANLILTATEAADSSSDDADVGVVVADTASGKTQEPKRKQATPEVKAAAKQEAELLSKAIKNVRTEMKSSIKTVRKNVKKGATSKKDLELIKAANTIYDTFCQAYDSASVGVKKKFRGAHKNITKQRDKLIKLSMATKKRQKSLAQRMADSYFQEKSNRIASDKEIKAFNGIIKDTIKHNKKSAYSSMPQKELFRATSFLLKKVGFKQFRPDLTDKVLEKIA